MFSGRHLLFLGALACAGLVSVRDGQHQVQLAYELAATEDNLRKTEQEIEVERAHLQALRVPAHVVSRVHELSLKLLPPTHLDPYAAGQNVAGQTNRADNRRR
jgi:hypothetical protein